MEKNISLNASQYVQEGVHLGEEALHFAEISCGVPSFGKTTSQTARSFGFCREHLRELGVRVSHWDPNTDICKPISFPRRYQEAKGPRCHSLSKLGGEERKLCAEKVVATRKEHYMNMVCCCTRIDTCQQDMSLMLAFHPKIAPTALSIESS